MELGRLVAVRDLETGEEASRPPDTLTVDVPADLPRGGIFTVADGFRASYTTAAGKQISRRVTPGPLGWRTEGETCLIARSGRGGRSFCHYRICRIAPRESTPLPGEATGER